MLILCHLFLSYLLILVLKIGYYVVNIPKVQTWFGSLLSNDSLSRARAALPLLNYMTLPFSNSLHARSVSSKFCNPGGPLKKIYFCLFDLVYEADWVGVYSGFGFDGIDELADGTWLVWTKDGRVTFLTNVRED